jgi:Raf kinase inhibitor-like YbhB/YbcL family protein
VINRTLRGALPIACILLALAGCSDDGDRASGDDVDAPATIMVESSAFAADAAIPQLYSCDGEEVSPPLSWTGVPDGAEELALVVLDPDADNYIHWVLSGIDPATTQIAEGAVPEGVDVVQEYRGPCPPSGTHRYVFTVYALSRPPNTGDDVPAVIDSIRAAASAQGELVGTYER